MIQYAELKCQTHYSFLHGASSPQECIDQAAALGLSGIAITDQNGVYGAPKAFLAAKSHPALKLIIGSKIKIHEKGYITLLAQTRAGYGAMCRLLTTSHAGKAKGEAALLWNELLQNQNLNGIRDIVFLPDFLEDFLSGENGVGHSELGDLKDAFPNQVSISLSRYLDGRDAQRTAVALALQKRFGIPLVATQDATAHIPERKRLQDVLTCIRERVPLDQAGSLLFPNAERFLKSPEQMAKLFSDLPEALKRTVQIAESCQFSMSELKYRYPSEWIPTGHTAQSFLESLVWKGAESIFQVRDDSHRIPEAVSHQITHELALIHELGFADYFLTIWDIVEFAKRQDILCQGRGSAANSVVCYALGITTIDPIRMNLLFERFISVERGEPPDIDVDFENGRREEVIQYIYQKYGRDRAAMVSAVITYRSRSAIREVTQVFGKEMSRREFSELENSPTLQTIEEIIGELKGFPRHLSIHSGGFTLSADPMIEIVPVEPARMEGRTIVQWDKYDLDVLGLLKVDILALGMLTALKKTLTLLGMNSLQQIPADDPATYSMMQKADTIGVFQIESRAQMSMLPRLLPKTFYDLVIEVALVRPGPIVGKMVHPYLKRRRGLEPIDIPHPVLEPILKKTLGVPIFQEQVMKIAIALAGFTPGEADQLRRAIGAWRSSGSIDQLGKKLMKGLMDQGVPREFSERIFSQIQGFSEYGFPESHAASFALIAYASAYLKCHFPAQFTCALLNSQPMGFYAPHTLVDDAKRHGVKIFPIHPLHSHWDCEIVQSDDRTPGIRIGFRYVVGMSEAESTRIITERLKKPFHNLADFMERTAIRRNILTRLALGGAFSCFGYDQRSALWNLLEHFVLLHLHSGGEPEQLSLFTQAQWDQSELEPGTAPSTALPSLSEYQSIMSDYQSYRLSTRGHPMQAIRKRFSKALKIRTWDVKQLPHGRKTRVAGLAVVMQRPPTAKGTVFATIEDETGFLDLILHAPVYEKFRELIWDESFLWVSGYVQRDGHSVSLIVRDLSPVIPTLNSDLKGPSFAKNSISRHGPYCRG